MSSPAQPRHLALQKAHRSISARSLGCARDNKEPTRLGRTRVPCLCYKPVTTEEDFQIIWTTLCKPLSNKELHLAQRRRDAGVEGVRLRSSVRLRVSARVNLVPAEGRAGTVFRRAGGSVKAKGLGDGEWASHRQATLDDGTQHSARKLAQTPCPCRLTFWIDTGEGMSHKTCLSQAYDKYRPTTSMCIAE